MNNGFLNFSCFQSVNTKKKWNSTLTNEESSETCISSTWRILFRMTKQLFWVKDLVSRGPERWQASWGKLQKSWSRGMPSDTQADLQEKMALKLKITFSKITNLNPTSTRKPNPIAALRAHTWWAEADHHKDFLRYCGTEAVATRFATPYLVYRRLTCC